MNNKYDASSIQHLETREAMRTRIQAYLGSDDTEGIYQAFKEIINNSTDEAIAGYGNEINIILNEQNNEITIIDKGRGVPYSTENGRNVLVEIYTESHTGGKFDKDSYKNSSGLNGLGGTAVCMSSEYFIVKSQRDNKIATAKFKKGILEEYFEKDYKSNQTGTTVIFKPDREVFKNMTESYSYDRICSEIKNIAYLNKKVKFIVENTNGKKAEFYSENGIADFIKDKVSKPLMKNPIIVSKSDETDEVEIAFIWSGDKTQSYTFVNGLYCINGGSTDTGAKTAITNGIKKIIGKCDIEPDIIRRGLVYAVNCKVLNPSFSNQIKDKITNPNLRSLTQQAFKEGLEQFSNTTECNAIIEMIKKMQNAEKAADRAREAVLNHTKEMNEVRKKKLAFIDKLSDAEILGQDAMLCITEGDSAGSSVAMGRDTKTTGILRIKGKMLNSFKAEDEKIFANEEIKLLLYALGIDINNYNPNKLRYGKIAICADQDVDGKHIALLIMANLYKLCPQFLKENRLYWLQSPLFIEYDKLNNPVKWWYSDNEFNRDRDKVKGTIKRIKGLGQLSEIDLKTTMFSPEGQRLDHIIYSEKGAQRLEQLMGEEVKYRKDFVFNNIDFSEYGEF